ncbi:DUF3349 domain-containing protein [Mycobacteroides franklinii]|uniref:DUF3349 domain-containing protein n=1 Tax=Mycobacteroides franklinii TaxID=948102 RepID=UPI0013E8B3AC|nr:hypothetical protein [Mycobacteroides franklinii]
MALPDILARIVKFLRAGYPNGVPATDYIPLLALLKRRLSDDEVISVSNELAADGHLPIDGSDIRVAVTKVTDDLPEPEDIERIAAHLATIGWPIADEFRPPTG